MVKYLCKRCGNISTHKQNYLREVSDEDKMEKIIIQEFKQLFTETNYGNDYFEGDRLEIKKAFHRIIYDNDWNKD